MPKIEISTKRLAISKANAQTVGVVAAAAFISVFCLVASKTVWSQNQYQAKVIAAKDKVNKQLTDDVSAYSKLASSYQTFDLRTKNIIGGSSSGSGDNDGRNAKIILDALPPSYDFPALASTLEKILTDNNYQISDITGVDDQLNQQTNLASPTPKPIEMPFSFTVAHATYDSTQQLIRGLQHSIRPIQIDALNLSGSTDDMTVTVKAHTYYQPTTSLTITKQVVK